MPRRNASNMECAIQDKNIIKRLIQISMETDKFIYNNETILDTDAQKYLREIQSYKPIVIQDPRSFQVIEKLEKILIGIIAEEQSSSFILMENNFNYDAQTCPSPVFSVVEEDFNDEQNMDNQIEQNSLYNKDDTTFIDDDLTQCDNPLSQKETVYTDRKEQSSPCVLMENNFNYDAQTCPSPVYSIVEEDFNDEQNMDNQIEHNSLCNKDDTTFIDDDLTQCDNPLSQKETVYTDRTKTAFESQNILSQNMECFDEHNTQDQTTLGTINWGDDNNKTDMHENISKAMSRILLIEDNDWDVRPKSKDVDQISNSILDNNDIIVVSTVENCRPRTELLARNLDESEKRTQDLNNTTTTNSEDKGGFPKANTSPDTTSYESKKVSFHMDIKNNDIIGKQTGTKPLINSILKSALDTPLMKKREKQRRNRKDVNPKSLKPKGRKKHIAKKANAISNHVICSNVVTPKINKDYLTDKNNTNNGTANKLNIVNQDFLPYKTTFKTQELINKKEPLSIYNPRIEEDLSWVENIRYVREIDPEEYDPELSNLPDDFWNNLCIPADLMFYF